MDFAVPRPYHPAPPELAGLMAVTLAKRRDFGCSFWCTFVGMHKKENAMNEMIK